MVTKRIPARGTPRHARYWAERRLLDELREMQTAFEHIVDNPDTYGDFGVYNGALSAIKLAVTLAEHAWSKGVA